MVGFRVITVLVVFSSLVLVSESVTSENENLAYFPLTIIHINDLHARFEETNAKSSTCSAADKAANKCIAGLPRVYGTIKSLQQQYQAQNPIYLNAGDNFQGSLWYTLLRWNVTAYFMKQLPATAMTLGNHEFDHAPAGLSSYIHELDNADIPTVVANMQVNNDPILTTLDIPETLVIRKRRRRIGIIGVVYDKTHDIAQTGLARFTSCVDAVRTQAAKLRKRAVRIIIVISHCGYDIDKKIAQEAGDDIDVIVGAHTHSLLYTASSGMPYDPTDVIEGDYPTVVNTAKGRKVLIVQAKSFGKYVGRLTVYFDRYHEAHHWEGYPIYMNNSVPQDPDILQKLIPWKAEVQRLGSQKIGRTDIVLERDTCRQQECNIGDLVADAYVAYYANATFLPIAINQAGTFRSGIALGDITNGDAINVAPFGNTVDMLQLRGDYLKTVIEHSLAVVEMRMNVLQVAGIKYTANLSLPEYSRVQSVEILDPLTNTYKPLDVTKEYYVATSSYLADGKDGFVWMSNAKGRKTGPLDSDVLVSYIQQLQVINSSNLVGGRVVLSGQLPA